MMRGARSLLVVLLILGAAAPARAQFVGTPYIDTHVAGDVQTGRGGVGASVGYYFRDPLLVGIELDAELHPHFFNDEDVAGLVSDGVDLNTDAAIFMGNVVVALKTRGAAGIWCPYGAAGLGLVRAVFDGFAFDPSVENYHDTQDNVALNVGGGVMHALTELVGLRLDARYFHAFVDDDAHTGGYFEDYGFFRVSVGATIGFPGH